MGADMRFRSSFLVVLAVLACLSSTSSAQELTIKRNLFIGTYRYSTDGANYLECGEGWCNLKRVVEQNQKALSLLNSARSTKTMAYILGIPGAFLLGWNSMVEWGAGRVAEPKIWVVGGAMFVGGFLMDVAAESQVRKAAKVYNAGRTEGTRGFGHNNRFRIVLSPTRIRVFCFF
jgi:hypothetical protein